MTKKVLFCATVDFHFSAFHLPVLKWFKEQNWEVHIAAQGELGLPFVDRKFNIPIERSPFQRRNVEAYRQLRTVIEENNYQIIHCHTPMGGVLTRLAARGSRKRGTKVIYTAHGFHFCKGSSALSWALYYPIEKSLARVTDCLITINSEDYTLATNRRFGASQIELVNGVGVNTEIYKPVTPSEKKLLRESSPYHPDEFLMFYAAEFNTNKNHQLLIRSLSQIKEQLPHGKLLFAGRGGLQQKCQQLTVELGMEHMVHFLGYRDDIRELLPLCDVAVSGSLREGLPVNIMEAMACGLPVIATSNRGHRELVKNLENGYIVDPDNDKQMAESMLALAQSAELRQTMGHCSAEIMNKYDSKHVREQLSGIYTPYMQQSLSELERLECSSL